MFNELFEKHRQDFDKTIDHLITELNGLRTGRASAGLLQTVTVDVYGAKQPLTHVASVSVQDAKTLVVSPWDKQLAPVIEKAITAANLGLTPASDGNVIRINVPALTEDRRKEMAKLVGQMGERARIGIRNIREEIIKSLKKRESDGEISQDDLAVGQKKLQEKIDDYNNKIKASCDDKEKEILSV